MKISAKTSLLFAVAVLLTGLVFAAFAGEARAGTRLYTGSYTIHAFGTDASFSAFPWHARCNVGPTHVMTTITFPTPGIGTQTFMITVPSYGGQLAVHDTTGGTTLDAAQDCFPAANQLGNPMVASGAAAYTTGSFSDNRNMSDPRKFTIAQGVFQRHQGTPVGEGTLNQPNPWSLSAYGPYAFDVVYTNFSNEEGTFSAGAGIGNFTWSETDGGQPRGNFVVTEGPHQFGGTMKLLGSFYSHEGLYNFGYLYVAKKTRLFQFHGEGGVISVNGETTAPGFIQETAKLYTTLNGGAYPMEVFGKPLAWTTGTVSVTATHGPFPTVLARHGFDNRDTHGSGEIQMVTPMLTRWVWQAGNYETASIAHLKLNFAPEPKEWLMLAAGISMLGLLYRSNRRRR